MLIAPNSKFNTGYVNKKNDKKIQKAFKSKELDNDREVADIIKDRENKQQEDSSNKSFQQHLKEKFLAHQQKSNNIPTETLIQEKEYKKEKVKQNISEVISIYKKN
jgi:hypothetical protein